MAPDPNLLEMQKKWAASEAADHLKQCLEIWHDLAHIQKKFIYGDIDPETAFGIRRRIIMEYERIARSTEEALWRLQDNGPVIGTNVSRKNLEGAAHEIRSAFEDLELEWRRAIGEEVTT